MVEASLPQARTVRLPLMFSVTSIFYLLLFLTTSRLPNGCRTTDDDCCQSSFQVPMIRSD